MNEPEIVSIPQTPTPETYRQAFFELYGFAQAYLPKNEIGKISKLCLCKQILDPQPMWLVPKCSNIVEG